MNQYFSFAKTKLSILLNSSPSFVNNVNTLKILHHLSLVLTIGAPILSYLTLTYSIIPKYFNYHRPSCFDIKMSQTQQQQCLEKYNLDFSIRFVIIFFNLFTTFPMGYFIYDNGLKLMKKLRSTTEMIQDAITTNITHLVLYIPNLVCLVLSRNDYFNDFSFDSFIAFVIFTNCQGIFFMVILIIIASVFMFFSSFYNIIYKHNTILPKYWNQNVSVNGYGYKKI